MNLPFELDKTYEFYGVDCNAFKIGDRTIEVVEDEDDGYRSCLGSVELVDAKDKTFFKRSIDKVKIRKVSTNLTDGWEIYSVKDEHVWLRFGTDHCDDYYPCFLFEYAPRTIVPFKDKAGCTVKPGDLIVYGHALGRCAGLRYGKALGTHNVEKGVYDREVAAWAQLQHPHLTVIGIEDDWDHKAPKTCRKGTLQFGTRVLVVNRNQVPEHILKLLDGIEVPS